MRKRTALRLARAYGPSWFRRPDSPLRAVVQLTRRCNERCTSCRSWDMPSEGEMSPDELGQLMRGMPRLVWLDLTGGEPFVRGDVVDCFDAVLEHPALQVLHFPTNGWFTDRVVEVATRVRGRRPDLELIVTVSLDGDEVLHDQMRGRTGAYRRAVATFEALLDAGVSTFVGTTVGPENEHALDDLEAALAGLRGFHEGLWHWNLYQHSAMFFGNEPWAGRGHAERVREQVGRRFPPRGPVDLMELAFLVNLQARLDGEPLGLDCAALHAACFVSADAKLYPCHVWDRPVADLRQLDFDLARAWALDATRRAQQGAIDLDCGGCFTPCEAYPALAGSPARAATLTLRRGLALARRAE